MVFLFFNESVEKIWFSMKSKWLQPESLCESKEYGQENLPQEWTKKMEFWNVWDFYFSTTILRQRPSHVGKSWQPTVPHSSQRFCHELSHALGRHSCSITRARRRSPQSHASQAARMLEVHVALASASQWFGLSQTSQAGAGSTPCAHCLARFSDRHESRKLQRKGFSMLLLPWARLVI